MTAGLHQFGKYRILEELGAGGFATVFKAVDTTLEREVALKILHPALLADRHFVQNFRQEAKTLAALRHPQIVLIYEVGEIDGRIFIAMDLARGASLAKAIVSRQRIPWNETLALLKPICDALDYAHAQGVVHRDLKPANILIDRQRGALLTDFGFAKLLAESSVSMSMSGGIVGTPGYIAPEVWENNAANPPVDIYALGCIFYEMLTGDVLFKGQTPLQAMRAHDRGPQFATTWPGDVPANFGAVLSKALARNPADRFTSAGALWQALSDLDAQAQAAIPPALAQPRPAALQQARPDVRNQPPISTQVAPVESRKPPDALPGQTIAQSRQPPAAQGAKRLKLIGGVAGLGIIAALALLFIMRQWPAGTTAIIPSAAPAVTVPALPTASAATIEPSSTPSSPTEPVAQAATPTASETSSASEEQHLEFGIVNYLYGDDREQVLALDGTAGFDWVKQQVSWKDIEQSEGQYNWGALDQIVEDTAAHKFKLLLTISQAPSFYTANGQNGLPREPKAMGAFVEALAAHYGAKVAAYEIWEEQNLAANNGGHVTIDDAGHYVDILVECYNRIKAVDPDAIVIAGAVASTSVDDPNIAVSDENYYRAMYQYKSGVIKEHFDAQAVRPYGSANPPETMWPDNPSSAEGWTDDRTFYFRRVEDIRKLMEEEGAADHQIWITGFGWATRNNTPGYEYGNQVSFEQQRDYIIGAIQLVYQKYRYPDGKPWVGVMFLWNMNFAPLWAHKDPPNPLHQEASFGILNPDYSPRPSFIGVQKSLADVKREQGR